MILSSVPQPEITFHTDYHGVGHGWICYELFCLKREIRDSSVDICVKSVSMILSLIICRDDTSMRGGNHYLAKIQMKAGEKFARLNDND